MFFLVREDTCRLVGNFVFSFFGFFVLKISRCRNTRIDCLPCLKNKFIIPLQQVAGFHTCVNTLRCATLASPEYKRNKLVSGRQDWLPALVVLFLFIWGRHKNCRTRFTPERYKSATTTTSIFLKNLAGYPESNRNKHLFPLIITPKKAMNVYTMPDYRYPISRIYLY